MLAFEVIEHLERKEGFELLEALKNLAPTVVISTPAGFYVQGKLRNNIYENHKSGWREKDFRNAGYSVDKYGLGVTLEKIARKLHAINVFHCLIKAVTKLDWDNAILVAKFSKSDAQAKKKNLI